MYQCKVPRTLSPQLSSLVSNRLHCPRSSASHAADYQHVTGARIIKHPLPSCVNRYRYLCNPYRSTFSPGLVEIKVGETSQRIRRIEPNSGKDSSTYHKKFARAHRWVKRMPQVAPSDMRVRKIFPEKGNQTVLAVRFSPIPRSELSAVVTRYL